MSAVEIELEDFLADEEEYKPITPFRVTDDSEAGWAMRQLRKHRKEIARLEADAKAELDRLADEVAAVKAWLDKRRAVVENEAAPFEGMLYDFLRFKQEDDPKLKTYHLPSGELSIRKASEVMEVLDEPAAIAWCEANDGEQYLRRTVKVAVDKTALKKADFSRSGDGQLFDGLNGEAIPGVRVTREPDKFAVKLNDAGTDPGKAEDAA